jgi:CRP/FNR family transcriptional regulator, cyclic AMP receptor protein
MTSAAVRGVDPSGAPPTATARSSTADGCLPELRGHRRPPRHAPAESSSVLTSWIGRTPKTVSLLDIEPDLGRGIDSQDWEIARQATRCNLKQLDRREYTLLAGAYGTGDIVGLVLSDGLISHEIALGEHVAFELLTPGDVLLLPAAGPDDLDLRAHVTLTALNPAEVIVLSKPFIRAAARWPSLLTNVHRRLEAQRRRLALQGLATHLPRSEDRLLLILWILAGCCGRVTPEGILIPLSLSHESLGRLAAARRPTITLALRKLETTECVRRGPGGHLTLGPAAHRRVQELTHSGTGRQPIGASMALHQPLPLAANL